MQPFKMLRDKSQSGNHRESVPAAQNALLVLNAHPVSVIKQRVFRRNYPVGW